jgi:hypothetical protein
VLAVPDEPPELVVTPPEVIEPPLAADVPPVLAPALALLPPELVVVPPDSPAELPPILVVIPPVLPVMPPPLVIVVPPLAPPLDPDPEPPAEVADLPPAEELPPGPEPGVVGLQEQLHRTTPHKTSLGQGALRMFCLAYPRMSDHVTDRCMRRRSVERNLAFSPTPVAERTDRPTAIADAAAARAAQAFAEVPG